MARLFVAFVATIACTPAVAEWHVDNAHSRLSFISIKAGDVAEIHRFTEIGGTIGDDGSVNIVIDLASVDTLIPIRDERMRSLLFEVVSFPKATIRAQVDAAPIVSMAAGATKTLTTDAVLDLHGSEQTLVLELFVARLSPTKIVVSSAKPVIVDARSLGLGDGVERLREIAGLPSISRAVPVDFNLVFLR